MNDAVSSKKVAIKGWLVLIGLAVWIGGVVGILGIVINILRFFGSIPPGTPFETVVQIFFSAVSIILLILFVKRKKVFVKASIYFLVYQFVYDIYFLIALPKNKVSFYAGIVYLPLYVISILYLMRSNRVKNTFLR